MSLKDVTCRMSVGILVSASYYTQSVNIPQSNQEGDLVGSLCTANLIGFELFSPGTHMPIGRSLFVGAR
jgi:hypothetical protein